MPVNKDYIGSDYYFDEADDPESIASKLYIKLEENELTTLKKVDGRRLKLEEVLTSNAIPALRAAFINFIVGGAVRQIQKGKNDNRKFSFLVHTEVAKTAHDWQQIVAEKLLEKLMQESVKESPLFKSLIKEAYEEIALSVNKANFHMPTFEEVLKRVKYSIKDGELLITSVNSDKHVEVLLDDGGQLKLRTPPNIYWWLNS